MQPNIDYVVEDQADKDDQYNHNKITDDFPYQIDSSFPDSAMNMPLNDLSIQENGDEEMQTLHDYDLDIDIEGELIKILSSVSQEGTTKEQNDY